MSSSYVRRLDASGGYLKIAYPPTRRESDERGTRSTSVSSRDFGDSQLRNRVQSSLRIPGRIDRHFSAKSRLGGEKKRKKKRGDRYSLARRSIRDVYSSRWNSFRFTFARKASTVNTTDRSDPVTNKSAVATLEPTSPRNGGELSFSRRSRPSARLAGNICDFGRERSLVYFNGSKREGEQRTGKERNGRVKDTWGKGTRW